MNLRMEHALERVRIQMSEEQIGKLEEAQDAWLAFREKVAELAGAPWGRGSMRPFIVAGAMSRVTKQRITDLEAELSQYEGAQGVSTGAVANDARQRWGMWLLCALAF